MIRELPLWLSPSKERRRFLRVNVDVPAMLMSTALGRVKARLVNLSQSGCCIRTRARAYRGDHFVLTIEQLGPRAVQAAWRDEGLVGLSFDEPLSWAVVIRLAARDMARAITSAPPGSAGTD